MILFVAWNLRFAAGLWLVFVAMSLEMLVWRWTRKWSTRKAVYLCMQCMFSLQLSAGEGFTSRHISLGWLHTDDSISSAQLWNRCQLLNQPKGLLNLWTMGACQPTDTDQFKNSCGFFNLRQLLADYWYSQDHISCCLRILCPVSLKSYALVSTFKRPLFQVCSLWTNFGVQVYKARNKNRKSGFSSKLWEVLELKMLPGLWLTSLCLSLSWCRMWGEDLLESFRGLQQIGQASGQRMRFHCTQQRRLQGMVWSFIFSCLLADLWARGSSCVGAFSGLLRPSLRALRP